MRLIPLILLIAGLLTVGCAVYTRPVPPPLKVEMRSGTRTPGAKWVSGHWKWAGKRDGYRWVPGHWKSA